MVNIETRLQNYLEISKRQVEILEKALKRLESQKIDLNNEEIIFLVDSLLFRFAKLQDFLGQKIFRSFLEYQGLSLNSFYDILKELEKEDILNIDLWGSLREIRNELAHEYPDKEEIEEKILFIISKTNDLIEVYKKIEARFYEIKRKREKNNS